MPDYIYVGDAGRVYYPPNAAALAPEPGETYTLRKDFGDGRWEPVDKPKKTPAKTPSPKTPAPAGDTKE